jgi:prepilin-type N-terminal cleavage/methylation domain-containing protein
MRCLLFVLFLVPTVLRGNPYQHESGLTLLELLVVVVLLGIIAGGAVVGYDRVQDQARYDATRFEMAEIRKALLQFRRDSGTNDFPGQGIYDCTDVANGNPTLRNPEMVFPAEAGSTNDKIIAWCQSPANFWMLFVDPFGREPEDQWNPDTHRGWNGPYLQRKSGYVDVGDNLQRSGSGKPDDGEVIENVWGIASPYVSAPAAKANRYLVWRPSDGVNEYAQYGTPYLLFDLDDEEQARIVSIGPDNTYDGEGANPCEPPANSDDIVLCLLR